MNDPAPVRRGGIFRFRFQLRMWILVVIFAVVGVSLYVAQHHVVSEARRDFQTDFQAELQSLHQLENFRNSALNERCRALVSKPRIHAALEDNALDLLYPSAKDELRDLMKNESAAGDSNRGLRARFYRFLDSTGAVLPASAATDVGDLEPATEAALGLKKLPATQQTGYLARDYPVKEMDEILTTPIFSSDSGEVISALVVGFKPLEVPRREGERSLISGIFVNGKLYMPALDTPARDLVAQQIHLGISKRNAGEGNFELNLGNEPHLLFYKWMNPESAYPPAYEVSIYPLAHYDEWKRRLRWQIIIGGLIMLAAAIAATGFITTRLSKPVEELAEVSERTEAALQSTAAELERTARYSADASHQLKSPVTILRAGLESLLSRSDFKPEVYEELSALLHQTYRLTGVIDDLLLLARMDAGHLQLAVQPINLSELIEQWLDDLSAMPDGHDIQVNKIFPAEVNVLGERRYTSLIIQNLLENARKYNRPGGKIDIAGRKADGFVTVTIGNTGRGISPAMRARLFQRFQRGANNEQVSGHGLGLNLARTLARLHGGDLRLVRSEVDWTEFEVRFRATEGAPVAAA